MITKTNAVKMSIKKWEKVKKWPSINSMFQPCGFCEYFNKEKDPCKTCPLYPDLCYWDGNKKPNTLFWRIKRKIIGGKDAGDLVEKMLSEIKERGKVWLTKK